MLLVAAARFLNRILGRIGYRIMYWPKPVRYEDYLTGDTRNKILHSRITPLASFSPWLSDPDFLSCYELISSHTLVDIYRCYELWSLVGELAHLDGDFIEIGVWRGGTGAMIAKSMQSNGILDTVYLCDTFSGVPKAGEHDTIYIGGEHADTDATVVTQLMTKLHIENVVIFPGDFPDVTGASLATKRFRFCHIDVDVFQSAKDILDWIWPRMVIGGVVVYDDYGFKGCEGVTAFVQTQLRMADRITLYNINGHAITVKLGPSKT